MSPKVLVRRRIGGTSLADQGLPARVDDPSTVLSFSHRSGFATLLTDGAVKDVWRWTQIDGSFSKNLSYLQPHGVLYSISSDDVAVIEKFEVGYKKIEIQIKPYNSNETIPAVAFVSREEMLLRRPVPPTARYVQLLLDGARKNNLQSEYVDWLEQVPQVPNRMLNAPEYSDTLIDFFLKVVIVGGSVLGTALAILNS